MLRSSPSNLSIANTPSVTSRPTVSELHFNLTDLVEWEIFATHLPNITNTDIRQIEHDNRKLAQQKLDLFGTWLRRHPTASWRDVITALEKAKENALANAITKKFGVVNSSAFMQHVSDITDASDQVQPSSSIQKVSIPSEEVIIEELKILHRSFTSLAKDIRCKLEELVKSGKSSFHDIAAYIEEAQVGIRGLTKLNTTDELFEVIRPHNDYLDCELLEMIVEEYLHDDDITHQVKLHIDKVKLFKCTTPIITLRNKLQQYASILNISDEHLVVTIKLQNDWGRVVLKYIEKLVQNLLQYQHKVILKVEAGSISIMILLPKEKLQYFIDASHQKLQFMRLMGIFMLQIGDTTVLQESENKEFTFDSALLESSQSGNNEAVQFLLDLGVNINYSNSEGKTALMLASEAGHEKVVQILVSAGANVNLQDSAGQSALMFADGNVGIACRLLLANADPDLQQKDGNTALHIACYKRQSTVAEALLSFGGTFVIPNTKGDTAFLASVRGNNTEILKLMLNSIPYSPFIVSLGVVYACRFGHLAAFNLFAKQLECTPQVIDLFISCAEGDLGSVIQHIMEFNIDPNTTLISGITPLMIASSFGNADVLNCLLEAEADVNSTDQDGYSPLTYAITGNTSLHIVQCLLEAEANPNVLVGGVTVVERAREKGKQTICDLLHKYSERSSPSNSYTPSVTSKPTVHELDLKLVDLVEWQRFATHLPNITNTDIRQIERDNRKLAQQKLDLFGTWLRRHPTASWGDVITALEKAKENALANVITKKFALVNSSAFTQRVSDITSLRPLVHQLVEYLSPLAHWQTFGIHLPCITNSTIEQIEADHQGTERRKLALYARWLTEYSDATWDHVYDALKKARQHELASVLQRKLLVSHSAKQLEVEERKVEVKTDTADEIATQIVGLHKRFALLETNIKDTLETAITEGQIKIKNIARYLERHLEDEQLILTDARDIDDLFHKLRPYYSYLECELLEEIVNQFVPGEFQTELKKYLSDVETFETLTTLQELKDAIEQALLPTQSVTPSTCEVILKVSMRWKRETKKCLNKLLEHIFSDKIHLLNQIRITVGSMCIRFLVPKSQVEMLIALATKHMKFMYLLGVFEMMINDIPVLMENENMSFTFESALLESSQSGNNEAVQFLLDLGVNINYSNSEGKTALMLACEAGHEEVVQTLVSAEADVNLQDSAGETALMLADGNVGVVHRLLLDRADPNLQRKDGNTALHIACYKGQSTLVELLLSFGAAFVLPNRKGDTAFLASVRGNNTEILKLMLNSIPHSSFIVSLGVVYACRFGHLAAFNLFAKQLECTPQVIDLFISCAEGDLGSVIQHIMEFNIDPNTTLISGITPLMIASSFGSVDVLDCLLEAEGNVNTTDQDGYSPLTYAITGNTSLHIVQRLLEAEANPNILAGGVTILERAKEKGKQTICDLLLKYSALHLYKRFTHLVDRIQEDIDTLINQRGIDIIFQITRKLDTNVHVTGLASKVQTSIDLFNQLTPYYDFLNFEILVMIVREFLKGDIDNELEVYHVMATKFEELVEIQKFKDVLSLLPQQEVMISTSCSFKLHRQWGNLTLKSFRRLYSYLLSDNQLYLSHMTVDVLEEVLYIKFLIPKLTQVVDLASEKAKKKSSLYLFGVIEIMLDDILVLTVDENKNFTFDSALLESSQSGNNEAVQFLLDLGVNVNYSNSEGKTALMLASEAGHEEVVQILLLAGASINDQDNAGKTALMVSKTKEIFSLLLKCNADINILTHKGSTPLIIASQLGHLLVVDTLLVEYSNDPNFRNEVGMTALLLATQGGHYQVVEVLLKNGADPNIHDNDGWTALILSSHNGHQQIVELLLEKQADPNVQTSKNGTTALIQASQNGNYQVVKVLLKNEADPNIHNIDGWTALILSSQNGHQQIVKLLLEKKVDPNVQNSKNGKTALIQASQQGHYQVVEILLKKGADPNIHNDEKVTALLFAIHQCHYQVVEVLLKNGADPNIHNINGWTALILSSEIGHQQIVELLLEKQVDPNVQNSKSGRTALIQASQRGHYQVVEVLLKNGADPNIHDNGGWTALLVSSHNGHQQIVELLLEKQVDPNVQNSKSGGTALIQASQRGHYQVVEVLLKNGADPNIHDNKGWTALIVSSQKGHQQIVKLLLEKQVDPNVQNSKNGRTALIQASQHGHYQVAEIILENGADPNIHDNEGWTALIVSSQNGHQQIVELLLEKKVDPNVQNSKNGRTALIQASQQGHYQVVEVLLKNGADPNIHNIDGWTALILSSENGHQQIVKLLLEKKVDPNVQNSKNGTTALIQASQQGHYQVVEVLLKNGANPNIHNNEVTALFFASQQGHYQMVEVLLKNGADPNIHNIDGWTALILSSQNGHQQIVELLLEKQVDPNVQNSKNGRTALIQSSQQGHYQVVEVLLKNGANPNIYNNEEVTALFFASQEGHYQVAEVLLKNGADPNIHDNEGWTALIVSSQNGHQQIVELLLEKQVDPNVQTSKNGTTALIQASQNGHYQVVEVLLQKGANPNIHNSDGWTALMLSSQNGHQQIVELLLEKQVDPNVQNSKNGKTALIQASQQGHYQVVEVLLKNGADPEIGGQIDSVSVAAIFGNIRSLKIIEKHTKLSLKSLSMGWYCACYCGQVPIITFLSNRLDIVSNQTELIISCAEGDLGSVVDQLMSGKISPDVELVHGVTPLMISSSCGHTDIVEALITAGANVNKTDEYGDTALDYTEHAKQDKTQHLLSQHGGLHGTELVITSKTPEEPSGERNFSTEEDISNLQSPDTTIFTGRKEKLDISLIMKYLEDSIYTQFNKQHSGYTKDPLTRYTNNFNIPILSY